MMNQKNNAERFNAVIEERIKKLQLKVTAQETTSEADVTNQDPATGAAEALTMSEETYRRCSELAALTGRFNPDDVFDERTDRAAREAVLNRLSAICIVETYEGKVQWLLTQTARKSILSDLIREDRLKEALEQPLPPTDEFGEQLRKVLREGEGVSLDGRTHEQLQALTTAIEAIDGLGLPQPDPDAVRSLMGGRGILDEYDILLNKGFFGRQRELDTLWGFLEGTLATTPPEIWTGLVLTGLGGAGKSTLLAKFARDVAASRKATIVILDFDRPGIDPNDLYWLETEMAKQVGQQHRQTQGILREYRQEARRHKHQVDQAIKQSDAEIYTEQRTLRHTVSGISQALQDIGAQSLPFLLVLDTFEEVAQRDLQEQVLRWLSDISERLWPTPLRVIFSGRLFDYAIDQLNKPGIATTITVEELEPAQAERLLVSLGAPAAAAKRLARSDVLPRRPLELKLLAKLIVDDPETSIEEIENDLRQGGEAGKELFTGLIYRRVLMRIKDDPIAQSLATPGMALRFVTTELIREVLVPALNLQPLDEFEATRALNKLASYSWLAYRGPGGEVWHRKDLRRSMLKVMIAQERENARRINEQAVAFFSQKSDAKERAEAIYHGLMLMTKPEDGDHFELQELAAANEFIGADAADLRPAAATLLRFAINGRVPMADVELLPNRYLNRAYRRTGRRLVNNREFGKAVRLLRRGIETGSAFKTEKRELPDLWETEALFAAALWEDYANAPVLQTTQSSRPSLKLLTRLVYPWELVAPDRVDLDQVEHILIHAPIDVLEFSKELSDGEAQTMLRCLSLGLVLSSRRRSLSEDAREAITSIVQEALSIEYLLTATFERKLLLLDFLASERSIEKISFSPSTMKIEARWIERFSRLQREVHLHDLINEFSEALERSLNRKRRTTKQFLGSLDVIHKKYKKGERPTFSLGTTHDEFLVDLIRGPDPEFRDPCRFALLGAFPDKAQQKLLGEIIASIVALPLDDLVPDAFADALAADPEHALEDYVELVDRVWGLGKLLRQARLERPQAENLGRVQQAFERWDEASRSVIRRGLEIDDTTVKKNIEEFS